MPGVHLGPRLNLVLARYSRSRRGNNCGARRRYPSVIRCSQVACIVLPMMLLAACREHAQPRQEPAPIASSPDATAPSAPPPQDAAVEPLPAEAGRPGGALEALGLELSATFQQRRFSWRLVEHLHWQAESGALPALPPQVPLEPKSCPAGMVLIEGQSLLDPHGRADTDELMYIQNLACTRWLTPDRGVNAMCDRFDPERWRTLAARLPRAPMRFCMDRYEFPNAYGEFPLVVSTFAESEKLCSQAGKRLCTETEWTFACEGEEGLPFPNGYQKDNHACNVGILAPSPPSDTFRPRFLERTSRGLDLAWHGRRSGESPECKSPFAIEDLTGNVDEWTRSVRPYGYKMILKGGHWGPGRHRCRPQTRGHGPFYIRYDQGFRCCHDGP